MYKIITKTTNYFKIFKNIPHNKQSPKNILSHLQISFREFGVSKQSLEENHLFKLPVNKLKKIDGNERSSRKVLNSNQGQILGRRNCSMNILAKLTNQTPLPECIVVSKRMFSGVPDDFGKQKTGSCEGKCSCSERDCNPPVEEPVIIKCPPVILGQGCCTRVTMPFCGKSCKFKSKVCMKRPEKNASDAARRRCPRPAFSECLRKMIRLKKVKECVCWEQTSPCKHDQRVGGTPSGSPQCA